MPCKNLTGITFRGRLGELLSYEFVGRVLRRDLDLDIKLEPFHGETNSHGPDIYGYEISHSTGEPHPIPYVFEVKTSADANTGFVLNDEVVIDAASEDKQKLQRRRMERFSGIVSGKKYQEAILNGFEKESDVYDIFFDCSYIIHVSGINAKSRDINFYVYDRVKYRDYLLNKKLASTGNIDMQLAYFFKRNYDVLRKGLINEFGSKEAVINLIRGCKTDAERLQVLQDKFINPKANKNKRAIAAVYNISIEEEAMLCSYTYRTDALNAEYNDLSMEEAVKKMMEDEKFTLSSRGLDVFYKHTLFREGQWTRTG